MKLFLWLFLLVQIALCTPIPANTKLKAAGSPSLSNRPINSDVGGGSVSLKQKASDNRLNIVEKQHVVQDASS